jgi:hypothetical protein
MAKDKPVIMAVPQNPQNPKPLARDPHLADWYRRGVWVVGEMVDKEVRDE